MRYLDAFENYIPFSFEGGIKKDSLVRFSIPGSYAREELPQDVIFSVRISSYAPKNGTRIQIDDIFNVNNGKRIGLIVDYGASVDFHNSETNLELANFKGNVAPLIFSTLAKILSVYCSRFKPSVVSFSAYSDGLARSYDILCKRAERTFGYIYASPFREKVRKTTFVLLSPLTFEKAKKFISKSLGSLEGDTL